MQKDYGKYLGSLMMAIFGAMAFYRWHQTGLLFFLLLVIRDFVASFFFLKRKPSSTRSSFKITVLAYVSAFMPLLYFSSDNEASKAILMTSDLLSILGFLIVALATIELGTSIGISPAKRDFVQTGIYRYIKHPMYLGYVVSEIGLVILNPLNAALFAFSLSLYIFRAKSENKVLQVVH